MPRKNVHTSGYARAAMDFYRSPWGVIDPLINHFPDLSAGAVYEPAAGDGRLTDQLIDHGCKVIASDLNTWGQVSGVEGDACPHITPGIDFLELDSLPAGTRWLVANPPYVLAQQFAEHALHLGAERVHLLLKASFLNAKHRNDLRERLVKPLIQMGRLKMLPPGVKDKGMTPTLDFAWFTFQQQSVNKPVMVFETFTAQPPAHVTSQKWRQAP